jgi:hypothetical protein
LNQNAGSVQKVIKIARRFTLSDMAFYELTELGLLGVSLEKHRSKLNVVTGPQCHTLAILNAKRFRFCYRFCRPASSMPSNQMKHVYKALCLWLLLITAQQGAVVHELSHISGLSSAVAHVESGGAADTACALCPAFAQASSPAFSHSFQTPLLGRATPEVEVAPQYSAISATVPRPRSRGPPSLS